MELDLHTDTSVCGYNCIVIHLTVKEYDVAPYTEAYDTVRLVPDQYVSYVLILWYVSKIIYSS